MRVGRGVYCDGGLAIVFRGQRFGPLHSSYLVTYELEQRGAVVVPVGGTEKELLCHYHDSSDCLNVVGVSIEKFWGIVRPIDELELTPCHESVHV